MSGCRAIASPGYAEHAFDAGLLNHRRNKCSAAKGAQDALLGESQRMHPLVTRPTSAHPCAHGSTQRGRAVDLLRAAGHALAAARHDVRHQRRACAAPARIVPGARQVSSAMEEKQAELTPLQKQGLLYITTLGSAVLYRGKRHALIVFMRLRQPISSLDSGAVAAPLASTSASGP